MKWCAIKWCAIKWCTLYYTFACILKTRVSAGARAAGDAVLPAAAPHAARGERPEDVLLRLNSVKKCFIDTI